MNTPAFKTHKIHLTEEKATLLITLYAKALDSRLKKSILRDGKADAMVAAIDFDFEKLHSIGDGSIMVLRAKQMDEWIEEFLQANSHSIVLNLGCGLDTRIARINPASTVKWFDVDFPEVVDLRKNFFANLESYQMIRSSVTEPAWLEKIPDDRPVMIVAEGLLEYLSEEDVRVLFERLTGHFTHGQIVFDVMNSFAIKSGKSNLKKTTGAEHKWAVDDVRNVDGMNPQFKRIDCISVFKTKRKHLLPPKYRLIYAALSFIPSFRNMIRLLRYDF